MFSPRKGSFEGTELVCQLGKKPGSVLTLCLSILKNPNKVSGTFRMKKFRLSKAKHRHRFLTHPPNLITQIGTL